MTSTGASFRDPSGYVYKEKGLIYRTINLSYEDHYEFLIKSNLYNNLVKLKLLIPHQEIKNNSSPVYKTIQPIQIPFISYPYEWCFSQLKAAALTTLKIQKIALDFGMVLKDASAFNIQFLNGKPILIDTLSFERYYPGQPWTPYRQFCMHFLAPLLLMKYKNIELNKLFQIYLDGIPLSLASSLLPTKTWLHPSYFAHIRLHAKSQDYFEDKKVNLKQGFMKKANLLGLIDNLENTIKSLNPKAAPKKGWVSYYQDNNYSQTAWKDKKDSVVEFTKIAKPKVTWDLGANTGEYSHLIANLTNVMSLDSDPLSVETNYVFVTQKNITSCLPLVVDLVNPSPKIGWDNKERMSLVERGPADLALALALIHHLAIANNIPLGKVASFMNKLCKFLIIEFIPKEDSQVQRLLRNRMDIFASYTQSNFEKEFARYFIIKKKRQLKESLRTVYLLEKR